MMILRWPLRSTSGKRAGCLCCCCCCCCCCCAVQRYCNKWRWICSSCWSSPDKTDRNDNPAFVTTENEGPCRTVWKFRPVNIEQSQLSVREFENFEAGLIFMGVLGSCWLTCDITTRQHKRKYAAFGYTSHAKHICVNTKTPVKFNSTCKSEWPRTPSVKYHWRNYFPRCSTLCNMKFLQHFLRYILEIGQSACLKNGCNFSLPETFRILFFFQLFSMSVSIWHNCILFSMSVPIWHNCILFSISLPIWLCKNASLTRACHCYPFPMMGHIWKCQFTNPFAWLQKNIWRCQFTNPFAWLQKNIWKCQFTNFFPWLQSSMSAIGIQAHAILLYQIAGTPKAPIFVNVTRAT